MDTIECCSRDTGLALVVLAAGIGSRYGGLKQLESVGPAGETLLEYSVFDALRSGFDHVVLVIRRETESEFKETLGYRVAVDVTLSYVHQELSDLPDGSRFHGRRNKPWGTGHAVLAVRHVVKGPFVVINADDFYGRDAFRTLAAFMTDDRSAGPRDFALAGFDVGPTLSDAGPVSRGLCRADAAGWLERIVEVLKLTKNGSGGTYTDENGVDHSVAANDLVSMNMWGFTPSVFPELESRFRRFLAGQDSAANGQPEFLIPDVVQGMITDSAARVRVLRHNGRWCGITFPEDRLSAQGFIAELIETGAYPHRLWSRGRDR
jgi:hypothetical protein